MGRVRDKAIMMFFSRGNLAKCGGSEEKNKTGGNREN
jgi:hypothetical protein